jgi:cytochrome c553
MRIGSFCLFAAATFALAGCPVGWEQGPIDRPAPPNDDDDDDDDDGPICLVPPCSPLPVEPISPELVASVNALFREKCSGCHDGGASDGGLSDLTDVQGLRERRLIGESAETSPLFKVITSKHQEGAVSPTTGHPVVLPGERDVAFVREWLDVGAPELRGNRERIRLDDYAGRLRADLATVHRGEQDEMVYVEFHAAYNNNRFSDAELVALANATVKLLNQLDVRGGQASHEGVGVVYDKNALPIAVRFAPKRFNLDKQRDVVDTIARLANRQNADDPFACAVPALPVLDLLHIAGSDQFFNALGDGGRGAFESAYANIVLRGLLEGAGLLAPGQRVFEPIDAASFVANGFVNVANVGVYDLLAAVDPAKLSRGALDLLYNGPNESEDLLRACTRASGASSFHRCVDRLAQSQPTKGATYLSFDVPAPAADAPDAFSTAAYAGPAGPIADPLVRLQEGLEPFAIASGEGLFQLPNRMLGAFAFNSNFQLLSGAPGYAAPDAITSQRNPYGSVASCGYCHDAFAVRFEDVMVPELLAKRNEFTAAEVGFASKMAAPQDDWNAIFEIDAQLYTETLRSKVYMGVSSYYDAPYELAQGALSTYAPQHVPGGPYDGIWPLGSHYRHDLTVGDIGAELGLTDQQVLDLAEKLDPVESLADLVAPTNPGITREAFTVLYQKLVDASGRGNEDFLRGCLVRPNNDGPPLDGNLAPRGAHQGGDPSRRCF